MLSQAVMEGSAARLDIGAEVAGRYRVIACLKRGGMGSVYEVLDKRTDRLRALKVMLPDVATDADMRERFEREAIVVGRVRSDHIVEVVDAGIADPDMPFLVMERLHGEDLATLLARRGTLEAKEVVSMLSQVASGLDKIHQEGVIHRDLKLENLFVTKRDDGSPHLKIVDFGVAKLIDYATSLSTTRSLGTPLFMAPEQLTGDGAIGPAADLYALAHAAFCLLAGKPYWFREADEAATPYAFISVVAKGASESARERARRLDVALPPAFDAWFEKATAKNPSRRFETATELVEALAVAHGLSALPSPENRAAVVKRGSRVTPAVIAVGAGVLLSGALLPLVCSSTRIDPPAPSTSTPVARAESAAPPEPILNATTLPTQPLRESGDLRTTAGATANASTPIPVRSGAASAKAVRTSSASVTKPYDPLDEL